MFGINGSTPMGDDLNKWQILGCVVLAGFVGYVGIVRNKEKIIGKIYTWVMRQNSKE